MRTAKLILPTLVAFSMVFYTLAIGLLAMPQAASAQVGYPTSIGYQGRLKNAAGTAISSGTYDFQFNFFNASSGGSELAAADIDVANKTVTNGFFSLSIPLGTDIGDFRDNLYLEVRVKEDAESTFDTLGRIEIFKTPYSIFTQAVESTSAPSNDFAGRLYYDTDDDTLKYYNGSTSAYVSVGDTLDEAYNNFGSAAQIITVDDASTGLSFDIAAAGNLDFDMQSTGDVTFQDSGTAWATFGINGSDNSYIDVDTTAAITFDADASSNFTTSAGTLSLSTSGGGTASSVIISSLDTSSDAINIDADGANGSGIYLDAYDVTNNTTGAITMDGAYVQINTFNSTGPGSAGFDVNVGGSGSLSLTTTDGAVSLDGGGSSGSVNLTSGQNDITLDTQTASRTISIGTSNVARTISLGSGSGADTMNFGSGADMFNFVSTENTNDAMDITFDSITTANGIDFSIDSLTSGSAFLLSNESTFSGNLWDTSTSAAWTGNVWKYDDTGNAAWTGNIFDIQTGTGNHSGDIFNVQLEGTTNNDGQVLVVNNSDESDQAGWLLDLDTSAAWTTAAIDADFGSAASTGNFLDVTYADAAHTGDTIAINTGTNLAGNALQVTTAGARTSPVFFIDGAGTDGGTDDHIFDINQSGVLDSNVMNITYSSGASTGNAIDINMGTNVSGDALNIATATTSGQAIDVDGNSILTTDLVTIDSTGATVTNGVDALAVALTTGDGASVTNAVIRSTLTSGGTAAGDIAVGLLLDLASTAGGTDTAIDIENTAAWDFDLDLQNDLTLSNATNNELTVTENALSFTLDFGEVASTIQLETASDFDIESTADGADAISLIATAGGIDIVASGASAGEDIDLTATGSSVNILSTENTADSIVLRSANGGIDIDASNAAAGEDIDITASGSSINLSATESVLDAITISGVAGGGGGGIDIDSGTNGITIDSTGIVSIDGQDDMNVTLASGTDAEDLTIAVTGATNSSLFMTSTGTGADALRLQASAGGIDIDAASVITMNTTDSEIQIATGTADTVFSGSADGTAAVTITAGDLIVSNGDLAGSGGDFSWQLDDGDTANIDGDGSPTATILHIGNGDTVATNGVGGIEIDMDYNNASGVALEFQAGDAAWTSDGGETNRLISIPDFSYTTSGGSSTFDAINIGSLTEAGAGTTTSRAVVIGAGWDAGISTSSSIALQDDVALTLGTGNDAAFRWETADVNANALHLVLPDGDGTNVPVFAIGDASMTGDLGLFNGITANTFAVVSDDGGDYVSLSIVDSGIATLRSNNNGLDITAVGASTWQTSVGDLIVSAGDAANNGTDDLVLIAGNAASSAGQNGNDIALAAEDDVLVEAGDTFDVDASTVAIDASEGSFSIDGTGVSSNLSLATTGNNQDLTIGLTGANDSSIIVNSAGTGADAISFITEGGINMDASSVVTFNTSNDEIQIATGTADTVFSGSADGTAAITITAGDLIVSNGDFVGSGGDFSWQLDDGDTANIGGDGSPTSTILQIGTGDTVATPGVGGIVINMDYNNASGAALEFQGGDAAWTSDGGETNQIMLVPNLSYTTSAGSSQLKALNIGNLTEAGAGTTTSTAITVGTGWDENLFFNDASTVISVPSSGGATLTWRETQTVNDLMVLTENANEGDLTVTGNFVADAIMGTAGSNFSVLAPNGSTSPGYTLDLNAGAGDGGNNNGGAVTIDGGVAVGSGTGGSITLTSGASAGGTGTAGNVSILNGAPTGGGLGAITIGSAANTDTINLITNDDSTADIGITGSVTISNDLSVTDNLITSGYTSFGQEATLPSNNSPDVSSGSHFRTNNPVTPVNINNFTNGVTGQLLFIRVIDGNTDLDCTSSGLNCGSTDISTAPGDFLTFFRDAPGTWQLVSFMDDSDNHNAGNGFDLAEWFPATGELSEGQVVVASSTDPINVSVSTEGYQKALLGVVSTQPGLILGDNSEYTYSAQVALAGRVPVNVTNENGAIEVGDYLTSSATKPGYAMKATETGPVIGMAMEAFNESTGQMTVKVDSMWYTPPASSSTTLQGGNNTGSQVADADSVSVVTSVFEGSVMVTEHLYGSRDIAGRARLNAGYNQVRVSFETEYQYLPIVTFSVRSEELVMGRLWISDEDTTGFTINHSAGSTTPYDLEFNWIAIGVQEALVHVSDGTTEEIQVTVTSNVAAEQAAAQIAEATGATEEPPAEEPMVEEPPVEEPTSEEPVAAEPPAEEPAAEEPLVEEPVVEELPVEELVAAEPPLEEPAAEEPVVEEPLVEEPVVTIE
ncbi:hypothetical protein CO174_03980 [Candidatus Uhrbacteria bacterium CG_4_9_14_3_um_filter_50_9]|uniref:Uncharacterized protein n=1 Tax=Candidatus Uhrbacteria bacterium CG_4_9_14_3_um_filter_50_9 TaxID=1975035 RepID=A0A2M7XBS3_9BACT|nr:MAG: hypothetical protein CO174_03980 [Candidatus Uhrbacteria bacterium CG_4_9_14_3_um_filter_50_9]